MSCVVGDSHIRTYCKAPNVNNGIMINQGRIYNLSSQHLKASTSQTKIISELLHFLGIPWFLTIGEPDCRYSAFGSYDTGLSGEEAIKLLPKRIDQKSMEYITACSDNLRYRLRNLSRKPAVIIGAGSPNSALKEHIDYFNLKIQEITTELDIYFFNPQAIYASSLRDEGFIGRAYNNPNAIDGFHFGDKMGLEFHKVLKTFPNFRDFDSSFCLPSRDISLKKFAPNFMLEYKQLFGCHRLRQIK